MTLRLYLYMKLKLEYPNAYNLSLKMNLNNRPAVYSHLCRILRTSGCAAYAPFDGGEHAGFYDAKHEKDPFFRNPRWTEALGKAVNFRLFEMKHGTVFLDMSGKLPRDFQLAYEFLCWLADASAPQLDEHRDTATLTIRSTADQSRAQFAFLPRHHNGSVVVKRL